MSVRRREPLGDQSARAPRYTELAALDSIDRFLRGYAAADSFSGSLLIAREGRVLLARQYGHADRNSLTPVRPDTKFNIASIGKMFTGVAVLQLAQAGRLKLDDTLGSYVKGFPPRSRDGSRSATC